MPRKAYPWYRANRGSWYATLGGKQVNLRVTDPGDEAGAVAAWRALQADAPSAGPGDVDCLADRAARRLPLFADGPPAPLHEPDPLAVKPPVPLARVPMAKRPAPFAAPSANGHARPEARPEPPPHTEGVPDMAGSKSRHGTAGQAGEAPPAPGPTSPALRTAERVCRDNGMTGPDALPHPSHFAAGDQATAPLTPRLYATLYRLAVKGLLAAMFDELERTGHRLTRGEARELNENPERITLPLPGGELVITIAGRDLPLLPPARLYYECLRALDALGRPAMPADVLASVHDRGPRRYTVAVVARALRAMRRDGLVGFDRGGGYTMPPG